MSRDLLSVIANDNRFDIVSIVTSPSIPNTNMPILDWCELKKNVIPLYTPKSMKTKSLPIGLVEQDCDLLFCCGYSLKIPKLMRQNPRIEAVNLHPSLVPRLRGADPIRRTIMKGDSVSGLSLVRIEDNYDSGDIFSSWSYCLKERETLPTLYAALSHLACNVIPDTLWDLANGNLVAFPQNEEAVSYAYPVTLNERTIHNNMSATCADRIVRANDSSKPARAVLDSMVHELAPGQYLNNVASTNGFSIVGNHLHFCDSFQTVSFPILSSRSFSGDPNE